MDWKNISTEILFRLEGNQTIFFSRSSLKPSLIPNEDQLKKKITGIQWTYAFCGEQDFGIEPMKADFETDSDGIIHKIPSVLNLDTSDGITVLKYGATEVSPRMFKIAKEVGMAGYWDEANFIICASKEYEPIIENIIDFLQPNKAKFALKPCFAGSNLLILAV